MAKPNYIFQISGNKLIYLNKVYSENIKKLAITNGCEETEIHQRIIEGEVSSLYFNDSNIVVSNFLKNFFNLM